MDNQEIIDLKKEIEKLKAEIEKLKTRRISQADVIPGAIKARHCSEGIRYLNAGLSADLPTKEDIPMQGIFIFYEVDTKKLKAYNYSTSDWDEVAFT